MAPLRQNSSHGQDRAKSTPPTDQQSDNDDVVPTIECDQQASPDHHLRLMNESEVRRTVNNLYSSIDTHLGQCDTQLQIQTCRLGQLRIEYKRTILECLLLKGLPPGSNNPELVEAFDRMNEWSANSWDVVVDYVSDVTGHRAALIECVDRCDAAMALLYVVAGNPAPRSYTSDLLISLRHVVAIKFCKCMDAIEALEFELDEITATYYDLRPHLDSVARFLS